jgi:DNA polymerase-1
VGSEDVKRTLLVDADIVAYKFACATETVVYFDGKDQPPCVEADLGEAIKGADLYLEELMEKLGATDLVICLTDRGNEFRKDFWPAYKANRKGRKPENLFKVLDHFAATRKTYLRPRLEADDCMGILSTHPTLVPGEKIIVSEDKDMQCIPGLLFNPRKDDEPRKIGKLAADRFHLAQAIIGDTCDNYPGAKGIGPKSAEVAAVMTSKTVEEMWRHVLAAFTRAAKKLLFPDGTVLTDEEFATLATAEATVQARCARILRASDWNFKEKRPVLWVPPHA